MKIFIKIFLVFVFIFNLSIISFAELERVGDYYRFKDGGEYVYSGFCYGENHKYYVADNGYVAVNTWVVVSDEEKYYASSQGYLYTNTVETIDGKGYAFDDEGKVQYGWVNGDYYANQEGYLVTGFQRLPLFSDSWSPNKKTKDVDSLNESGWFYFNPTGTNKYKKYVSDGITYSTKNIDNKKYCFDQNGLLCTGWKQIKETEPIMAGYMFFSEEETDDFAYGQALTSTWYSSEGVSDDVIHNSTEVRYYYFLSSGYPVCAKEGKYVRHRIGQKSYCFNDRGYAIYGIKKCDNDYYYFGDSVMDCSMRTGKVSVDTGEGYKLEYYFDKETGKGYSGVYNNKLYYKGLLQKGAEGCGCEAIKVEGKPYLVNSNGHILKNRKNHKDSDGVKWSSNSSGIVTFSDGGEAREPEEPEEFGDE